MIAEELRQAIRVLKDQGRPLREISRTLKVSRNTVRRVLRERERPETPREDPRIQAIVELLPDLYRDCKGNAVRIGEVLKDTHCIEIAVFKSKSFQVGKTPVCVPEARPQADGLAVGLDGFFLLPDGS